MAEAFPLSWPHGYPRTEDWKRRRSDFKAFSFAQARDSLMAEIRRLGARNPVLSTNVPLKRDGLPYANQGPLKDPGVAVYFTRGHGAKERQLVLACDRWNRIEDNMRAIERTIDAMRGMERWGCSDMLDRAFTGFTALPPPPPARNTWWEILGFDRSSVSLEACEDAYRTLIRRAHPDLGGSHEAAQRLNNAIAEARRAKSAP